MQDPPTIQTYATVLGNLCHNLMERSIKKITLSRKGNNTIWEQIKNMIKLKFVQTNIVVTICNGTIQLPVEQDRIIIIKENHESPVGGHKGVTSHGDSNR